jgi:adhesin transport system membrane fusion protein
LQALLDGREPDFGQPEDQQHANVIARSRAEFVSTHAEARAALHSLDRLADQKELEMAEIRSRLASTHAALEVAQEQFEIMEKLHASRAASRADYLTAKSRKLELEGQAEALELTLPRISAARLEIAAKRDEQIARFRAKLSLRLNEASTKLAVLRKTETVDADRVSRAQLRAPVRGIIKTLYANTIGQVVKPAEKIVEIVPIDDALLVRVEVSPKDIAFLHQGQEAIVKLTAYDYALYGTLKGRVVRIGADSIIDDRGNTHFPVDVKGDVNWIESDDKRLPVLPGMVAQVDIVTGHKTVFDYITKPIHRTATGAFGER